MSRKDGDRNWFEQIVNYALDHVITDNRGREMTAEEIEEMRKYAENPQAYTDEARANMLQQHLDYANQQAWEALRADAEERERRAHEP